MFSNPFLIQLSAVFTNLSSVFLSFTNFLKLSCTAGLLAVFLSQPSIDERSEFTRVIAMEFDRGLLRVTAVVSCLSLDVSTSAFSAKLLLFTLRGASEI